MNYRIRGPVSISYYKKLKVVTLLRYITSLLYYFPKGKNEFKLRHLFVLFDLMLKAQDLAAQKPSFKEKFGYSLSKLSKILKKTKFSEQQSLILLAKRIRIMIQQDLRLKTDFIYPERNVKGLRTTLEKQFKVIHDNERILGTSRKSIKPKPVLGQGYNDKGSSRKKNIDGSPSWQEVASDKYFNPPESYYDEEENS